MIARGSLLTKKVATHKDKDKSDRTERYRADAETDYNPTPYYVVQLVEKESPVKEVSKSIEEKDSRIESLIEDSKATTEGKSAVLPEEVNDASGSIEYRGTVYEPMIIETGDVPEKMARDIVERVNSGEYGV
ncbi:MAG: hypothetical protein ACLFR5_06170 [Halobacteriales archaeon]